MARMSHWKLAEGQHHSPQHTALLGRKLKGRDLATQPQGAHPPRQSQLSYLSQLLWRKSGNPLQNSYPENPMG